jgi:hypothetical protein
MEARRERLTRAGSFRADSTLQNESARYTRWRVVVSACPNGSRYAPKSPCRKTNVSPGKTLCLQPDEHVAASSGLWRKRSEIAPNRVPPPSTSLALPGTIGRRESGQRAAATIARPTPSAFDEGPAAHQPCAVLTCQRLHASGAVARAWRMLRLPSVTRVTTHGTATTWWTTMSRDSLWASYWDSRTPGSGDAGGRTALRVTRMIHTLAS